MQHKYRNKNCGTFHKTKIFNYYYFQILTKKIWLMIRRFQFYSKNRAFQFQFHARFFFMFIINTITKKDKERHQGTFFYFSLSLTVAVSKLNCGLNQFKYPQESSCKYYKRMYTLGNCKENHSINHIL